jgi:hypothetical protein
MLGLVITTLRLPNGILHCLSLIKFNCTMIGMWNPTEERLYIFFLILEVRNIPQQIQESLVIRIHGNFPQLLFMELFNLHKIIPLINIPSLNTYQIASRLSCFHSIPRLP